MFVAWVVVLVFWLCSLCMLFAGLLVFFLLLLCAPLHFELADLLLPIFSFGVILVVGVGWVLLLVCLVVCLCVCVWWCFVRSLFWDLAGWLSP